MNIASLFIRYYTIEKLKNLHSRNYKGNQGIVEQFFQDSRVNILFLYFKNITRRIDIGVTPSSI